MAPAIFAGVFASIRSMCACVRLPHASASFPNLCGSFGHNFGLVLGKFDFFWLFQGVLTCSDVSIGFCESFTTLCTCVHMSGTSVWLSRGHSGLSTYNFAPLAGKFGLADMFAGMLKLLVILCMHACVSDASVGLLSISGSPIHGSVPLAGESGITDMFSGVLEPFVSPYTCLYMFSMFAWLFATLCMRVQCLTCPIGFRAFLAPPVCGSVPPAGKFSVTDITDIETN